MILDKAKMAHDWAIARLASGAGFMTSEIVEDSWKYADAMQAEADKREKEESKKKRADIREMLKDNNTFVEREGQHFDDVEWQPDWSQAHNGYDWFAIDKCGDAYFYTYKPYISNGYDIWADADYTFADGNSKQADSSFNYQGNWQDSLRKRPQ